MLGEFERYEIAGKKVAMLLNYNHTWRQARGYVTNAEWPLDEADITVEVPQRVIDARHHEHPELTMEHWEYMLSGYEFYRQLLKFDGFMLHSSCVVLDNTAYVFSADSGTGKSTHTELWLEYFGERAYILNDDKPAILVQDGKIYACGTPWSGKSDQNVNRVVPLGGIVLLERAQQNVIVPVHPMMAVQKFMKQTIMNLNEEEMDKHLTLLDYVLTRVPIYRLGCNISHEAVEVAHGALTGERK
ncbi:MAG: hypothetical protein E7269_00320 [Lachnospiraceae bacterium]|nr:hypothetical protein [Lachnospiraceae bacterium]